MTIRLKGAVFGAFCFLFFIQWSTGEAQRSRGLLGQQEDRPTFVETGPESAPERTIIDTIRAAEDYVDPELYLVGPGDRFTVLFISTELDDLIGRIGVTGDLFLKSVGSIPLKHILLVDAIQSIDSAVSSKYTHSDFTITLSDYRQCKIFVTGEVNKPGYYQVPATVRVSEVIRLAEGLTKNASQRNILFEGFGKQHTVDLLSTGLSKKHAENPMVCRGNHIYVPARPELPQEVTISGAVHSPGAFEYVAGDRVGDLIDFAQGIKIRADRCRVYIYSQSTSEPVLLDLSDSASLDYEVAPGDNLKVASKDDSTIPITVTLSGYVNRPGRYKVKADSISLNELLELGGGVARDGAKARLEIHRTRWEDEIGSRGGAAGGSGLVSYSLRSQGSGANPTLIDRDSVYVPRVLYSVAVSGSVASPGLVQFVAGKKVDYYIRMAGGYGPNANRSGVVVINPVSGSRIEASAAGEMYDGEMIFVPEKKDRT